MRIGASQAPFDRQQSPVSDLPRTVEMKTPRVRSTDVIEAIVAAAPGSDAGAAVDHDPMLTNRQSAREIGVSLNTFYVMLRERKLPPAYYVRPKAPRWLRSELRAAKARLPRGYPDEMKADTKRQVAPREESQRR